MPRDLTTRPFFNFPPIRPFSLWDEDEDWNLTPRIPGGLSVSEDDKNVYIEAAVPGIEPKDVEITFDKGMLWIKGEAKQEEKNKKYYRKAASMYSYRVAIPGEIDLSIEPEAVCKNGVMTITFAKSPKTQPKKITVKTK